MIESKEKDKFFKLKIDKFIDGKCNIEMNFDVKKLYEFYENHGKESLEKMLQDLFDANLVTELTNITLASLVRSYCPEKGVDISDPRSRALWKVVQKWEICAPEYSNIRRSGNGSHVAALIEALDKFDYSKK